jgi:S1-C subfamily serine protease
MLDVRRLPSALIIATFALSGVVATSGVAAVAVGVGGSEGFCPGVSEDRPAGDILDCLGPSTAYIETALGSGSGLVLPDGYLLTNAHVVNPFDEVKVTIGDEEHEAVKVVGVDLFADIAVIGPVETEADPVHLVDPADLEKGDELFLVGYPGEANTEDLEPTVADGILSRTRTSKTFDLHYLQTDASIGGGQSGGALVDRTGGVVGISSLRFAENFALALSGADAQAAVDDILAGNDSEYTAWPGGEQKTDSTIDLQGDYVPQLLNVAAAPEERTIEVTVPADVPVMVVTSSLEEEDPLEVMGNLTPIAAEELDVPAEYISGVSPEALKEVIPDVELGELLSPGRFRFGVPAGQHVTLNVMTNRAEAFSIPVTTSLPVSSLSPPEPKDLTLGESIDTTVGTLVPFHQYKVQLSDGQEVHIEAGSPSGDMRVVVKGPNGEEEEFDDSRAGLYGVDVDEVYTAPSAGEYVIQVGQVSDAPTGYHLVISGA